MPQPVVTVLLGATDISTYCAAPPSGTSLAYGRGANFDGSTESPGYCQVSVKNNDRRFDPYNASSSLISVLKLGKKVRVTAVYSAVTYYLFDGFLTRITSDPETGFATLWAEDAMGRFAHRSVSLGVDDTRSLVSFRAAILDYIGESGTARVLSLESPEQSSPLTGASGEIALSLLTDLNRATGSLHYINPTSTAYSYATVGRMALQSEASVETFSDTDFTQPFATQLGGFDYTTEGVINHMRVQASPRYVSAAETLIWELPQPLTAAATTTVETWAYWSDPLVTPREVHTILGAGTLVVTIFDRSAKIAFTAGASDDQLLTLSIYGHAAPVADLQSVEVIDAASQTAYDTMQVSIESEYLENESAARGLATWYIFRYKEPQPRPPMVIVNRFPSQLQRDIGERITLTSAMLSLSAAQFFIRAFETRVHDSGSIWETEYQLEGAPALLTLFTVGGTAAQGVGGTGVLGY